MQVSSSLLDQYGERCIKLAYQCQNKNAERFFRLLAVRPRRDSATDEFAELDRLSREAAAPKKFTRENVSTA